MAKVKRTRRRSLFRELMSGVSAMREHREGRPPDAEPQIDASQPSGALGARARSTARSTGCARTSGSLGSRAPRFA